MPIMCCLYLFRLHSPTNSCICILHVEVSDGSYMLVLVDEDEGVGGDMHYAIVDQDPDQSPEVCLTASAGKGKPQFIINLCVSL
jgi:hypothetical protein